jgi:hypothetical protein
MEPIMPESKTVTISAKEYATLLADSKKLGYLEAYGVDNWEGYGEAMTELYDGEDED